MAHHEEEHVDIAHHDGKALPDAAQPANHAIAFYAVLGVFALVGVKYGTEAYLDHSHSLRNTSNISASLADAELWQNQLAAYDAMGMYERACDLARRLDASAAPISEEQRAAVAARLQGCTPGQVTGPSVGQGHMNVQAAMDQLATTLRSRNSVAVLAPVRTRHTEVPWVKLAEAPTWYPSATPASAASHQAAAEHH